MASGRIKGITIEINGDTTGLQNALSKVDKSLKTTNTALKDVNKLLKLDPGNTDLLRQKQEYLGRAINDVKEKLKIEKEAYEQLKNADPSEENAEKQKALEREIIDTEQALKRYEEQLDETEKELQGVKTETGKAADATDKMERETKEADDAQRDANQGWTTARQVLADLASRGIQLAIEAIKRLAREMAKAIEDAGEFADEIQTLSRQTGLSTDTLQEFRYMARLIDTPLEAITGSLRKLTNNMQSAASGTGAAYEAFSALGVSVTDSSGHLRRAEDVFGDTIDALRAMTNETERDAYSMDIFGRSAQDLNPLIEAGADAIEAFAAEAHEMGYVLDDEMLESLGAMDDSFERIKLQMEAVRNQIIAEMAPAIEEIATAFLEWAQTIDWSAVGQKIGEILDVVSRAVNYVLDNKDLVVTALEGLAVGIMGAVTAQLIWNAAMAANPIGIIIEGVTVLGALLAVFEDKTGHVSWSWGVAIEKMIDVGKQLLRFIIDTGSSIIKFFWNIGDQLRQVWEAIKGVFEKVRDFFVERFQGAYNDVIHSWDGAPEQFAEVWEGIRSPFTGVDDFFSNSFRTAFNSVTSIWRDIPGFFAGLDIQLPHIRLPHFNITGEFRLNPPSVPHMSVDWYDTGGIFSSPTIIGVGERRPEFVGALDDLRKIVAEESRAGSMTLNMTVNAAPGQSETQIANMVIRRIQMEVSRKEAVFG